jgi:outer membrane protein assembly factor BamE (lipoprotein component of BamABCDE complex)
MLIRPLLLAVLLLPASVLAQWGPCGARKDEVLLMGRQIEKEVPLGSTEAQVAKFLGDMHLQHSAAHVDRHDPVRRYRRFRQLGATIETTSHNEPAMYLQFYFDKRGKLVESVVRNAVRVGLLFPPTEQGRATS